MNAGPASIHDPDCSIWDIPAESRPEALIAAGYRDEHLVDYLSSLRPVYDAIRRCLGQMAGLLLLAQTRSLDPHRGDLMRATLREQLAETSERLRAIGVPDGAERHFATLETMVRRLEASAAQFDRQRDLIDPSGVALDAVMASLFSVQNGLLATAAPRAGLAPVDFTGACCTCRPMTKRPAH